ncbi:MAG TPA: M1 family metallopeptidase [Kofleriaceae bacterium]|nr:M1 family metallopeptidase [Kofleriaceae bacterium]
MRRPALTVALAITLALGVSLAACGQGHGTPRTRPLPKVDGSPALRGGGAPRSSRIASYKIEAKLDPIRHQITATETLTWTNPGQSAVDMLPFHLYLNGFKNEQSLFMRTSGGTLREAHATTTGWGFLQIDSVHVAGADLTAKLHPPAGAELDESVVELPLAQPVEPGATVEVAFKFTAQLPEVFARTGYKNDFHMVGQWFPKIGVRVGPPGAERWECRPFHANNEFFADFGSYDVALTVPSSHTVAATGVLTNAVDAGRGLRTLTYHAEDVHDFAWMSDPYMEVMSGQAKLVGEGTVEVRVYFRPEQREFARRHLEAATGAVEKFSAMFLPYPWPILSVIDPPVEAVLGAGGMEYPTLVTTGGDSVLVRPGMRLPESVTVHEVGHNWFQGMLASNEPEEAWLDEGVDTWADAEVMNELYSPRTSAADWMGWQAEVAAFERALFSDPSDLPSPIATAAYAFVDSAAYGEASYYATSRALATLAHTVGSQHFAAAMKVYAKTFAFRHPTGRDLFSTLTTELGQDLTWFVGPVFQQVGGMALKLRHAECQPAHPPRGVFGEGSARKLVTEIDAPDAASWACEVTVQNTGPVHVPVDIELKFADGSTKRVVWDDRGAATWERFTLERSSRLVEVWLDPEAKIALDNPMTHHYRLDGDGAASRRAGAWVGSVAQTIMQIVGP